MSLAYEGPITGPTEVFAVEAFIRALDGSWLARKVRECEPTKLDEATRHAKRYESYAQCHKIFSDGNQVPYIGKAGSELAGNVKNYDHYNQMLNTPAVLNTVPVNGYTESEYQSLLNELTAYRTMYQQPSVGWQPIITPTSQNANIPWQVPVPFQPTRDGVGVPATSQHVSDPWQALVHPQLSPNRGGKMASSRVPQGGKFGPNGGGQMASSGVSQYGGFGPNGGGQMAYSGVPQGVGFGSNGGSQMAYSRVPQGGGFGPNGAGQMACLGVPQGGRLGPHGVQGGSENDQRQDGGYREGTGHWRSSCPFNGAPIGIQ